MRFRQLLLRSPTTRPHHCPNSLLQSLIPQSPPSPILVQVRHQPLRISSINPLQSRSKTISTPITLPGRRIVVAMASSGSVQKSEEEWRAILAPEQFRILRQKGTEYPGTGEYNKFFGDGIYECAGCGTPLYKSTTKFDSGCGWPAFFEGLPGAITRTTGGGSKLLAQLVADIWVMFSRVRVSRLRPMSVIVSIAFRSSSRLALINSLSMCLVMNL
ncbi:Peptide-methionine (R)-S-oxide reductase protein [Dioscorea alata]|uniref:Peptide-methionine (R)-S-oxide reductase protein n=1 Tax=Dioscorea alata TaxID=55571 RepID=A0ACB7V168_DIOAL|nr:Peptide-methionine (R)-S-oxide reductase protein [Dioscorea alata]